MSCASIRRDERVPLHEADERDERVGLGGLVSIRPANRIDWNAHLLGICLDASLLENRLDRLTAIPSCRNHCCEFDQPKLAAFQPPPGVHVVAKGECRPVVPRKQPVRL